MLFTLISNSANDSSLGSRCHSRQAAAGAKNDRIPWSTFRVMPRSPCSSTRGVIAGMSRWVSEYSQQHLLWFNESRSHRHWERTGWHDPSVSVPHTQGTMFGERKIMSSQQTSTCFNFGFPAFHKKEIRFPKRSSNPNLKLSIKTTRLLGYAHWNCRPKCQSYIGILFPTEMTVSGPQKHKLCFYNTFDVDIALPSESRLRLMLANDANAPFDVLIVSSDSRFRSNRLSKTNGGAPHVDRYYNNHFSLSST